MTSFLISLHPKISNLGNASPLLYPWIQDQSLFTFWPNGSRESRIKEGADEVFKELDRGQHDRWQLIFLLPLTDIGNDPFDSSICSCMDSIRDHVLKRKGSYRDPDRILILVLDEVHEAFNQSTSKSSDFFKQCHLLDTGGFILKDKEPEEIEFWFSEMDTTWESNTSLGKEIANHGFDALSPNFQNQINKEISELLKKVESAIHPDQFDDLTKSGEASERLFDQNACDLILSTFKQRIQEVKQNPEEYKRFKPSIALQRACQRRVGIFTNSNKKWFNLIRLPFRSENKNEYQERLLSLFALIAALVSETRLGDNLNAGNYWAKVSLKKEDLVKLSADYYQQIVSSTNQLKRQDLEKNNAIEFDEQFGCGCSEVLEEIKLNGTHVGFMNDPADLVQWKEWNQALFKKVRDYKDESGLKVQRCIERGMEVKRPKLAEKVENLDERLLDLKREKEDFQSDIHKRFVKLNSNLDWSEVMGDKEVPLKKLLNKRPGKSALFTTLISASILLLIPLLFFDKGPEFFGTSFFAAAVVFVGALLLTHRHIMKGIGDILRDNFADAKGKKNRVAQDFENQKKYLADLCKLQILRVNQERVALKINSENRQNLLVDYHLRQLEEHRKKAIGISSTFGQPNIDDSSTSANREVNITKPVYENAAYQFYKSKLSESEKLEINLKGKKLEIDGRLASILDRIDFEADRVYQNPNAE